MLRAARCDPTSLPCWLQDCSGAQPDAAPNRGNLRVEFSSANPHLRTVEASLNPGMIDSQNCCAHCCVPTENQINGTGRYRGECAKRSAECCPGAAVAGRGGLPAYGHSAVRGPRKIDQGPGCCDGGQQADPAGRAKSADVDEPQPVDMYEIGTLASILQLLKLPDGTVKVLVEGRNARRSSG